MALRERLEMINSSSRVKLPANPENAMVLIRDTAAVCLRHHPMLALSTWKSALRAIRMGLEELEHIYQNAEEPK